MNRESNNKKNYEISNINITLNRSIVFYCIVSQVNSACGAKRRAGALLAGTRFLPCAGRFGLNGTQAHCVPSRAGPRTWVVCLSLVGRVTRSPPSHRFLTILLIQNTTKQAISFSFKKIAF